MRTNARPGRDALPPWAGATYCFHRFVEAFFCAIFPLELLQEDRWERLVDGAASALAMDNARAQKLHLLFPFRYEIMNV